MGLHRIVRFAVASGIPSLVGFAAIALYSRLLTQHDYGVYAVVLATVGLVNGLAFQWLRSSLRRFLPGYPGPPEQLLVAVRGGHCALVCATLCVAAMGQVCGWAPTPLIVFGAGLVVVQSWAELGLEIVVVRGQVSRYGAILAGRALISLAVGVGLVRGGAGAVGALTGVLVGHLMVGIATARSEWRGVALRRPSKPSLAELARYGLPTALAFGLQFVLGQSDRYLLLAFRGNEAVGAYAAGYDLTQYAVGSLMMIVNLALYPGLVRAVDFEGLQQARAKLGHLGTIQLAIALPAAVGLGILAPSIGQVVLGAPFRAEASLVIPLVAAAALLGGLKAFYADVGLQMAKATSLQLASSAVAAVVNVGLNLVWIPMRGGVGAAEATLVAVLVGLVLSIVFSRRLLPVPLSIRERLPVVLATGGMAGVLVLLPAPAGTWGLAARIGLGTLIYGLGLVVLDGVSARRWAKLVGITIGTRVRGTSV